MTLAVSGAPSTEYRSKAPTPTPFHEFVEPFEKAAEQGHTVDEDGVNDAVEKLIERHVAGDISKEGALAAAFYVLANYEHNPAGRRVLLMFIALSDEWGQP